MKNILTDLRYQWRASRRSLAATLAIISMLALGTGGVTTVFNHVYSMLFGILRLALWLGTRAILFGLPFGLFLAWILSRTLMGSI